MNKVFNINLGGYPFTIDEDAYEHLSQYLDIIHRHFSRSEGYEEITQDIESRLAELFQENLGNRPIVTLRDVRSAISTMGTPEEFGADPMEDSPSASEKGRSSGYKTGKRLFRDPEESIIGGVSSGIAAYLGISDPLWVRLAFIIVTISGGFGIPIYIILWAILPQAETAADRLAMRGEPINVSNIGRIIEEEINNLSSKVSGFSDEFTSKKKRVPGEGDRANPIEKGVALLGLLIRKLIDLIGQIWRPLLLLIGIILIIMFAIAWIGSIIGFVFGLPVLSFITPDSSFVSALGAINLLFLISVPVVAVLLLISRLLFGSRVSRRWQAGLGAFWTLNVISFFLVGSLIGRQFAVGTEIKDEISLENTADTLELRLAEDLAMDAWFNIDNEIRFTGDKLVLEEVRLYIEPASEQDFKLTRKFYGRGIDLEDANRSAQATEFDIKQDNNRLTIDPGIALSRGEKWRAQHVDLVLEVPDGKTVFIGDGVHRIFRHADLEDRRITPWKNKDQFWKMTENGLACENCKEKDENERLSLDVQ